MWSKPSLSTSLLHRNNLDCHDTPDTRSAHPFRFSRTACPPTHLAAGRCFLVRGFQIKRHRLSSSHMCSFRCNNCTGGTGRSPLLKNDDRLPSDQIHGGLNKQRTWRKDYFFFFFAWRFILPLSSLRGLTSIDGCPSVNKTHGSNQMTVEHRSTRHGTSRSAQSLWAGRVRFYTFLNRYWRFLLGVWRISVMCDEAAALRDFLCRTDGAVRGWEDTGSAVGGFFITVHMCLSFMKPTVRLRKSTHLAAQPDSKFKQLFPLSLSWRLDWIYKLFRVFSPFFLITISGSPRLRLVLISCQFMTLFVSDVSLWINVFPPSFLSSALLALSLPSVCAVWMSSYIISMPLALIIDSSCRSPPTSSSPFADTEFWGDPWTLSPSAFRFPPQNSHWISTFLPSRPFLIILFLPFNK